MTHPFIIGAIETTEMTSMRVSIKHADYSKFSYFMELSFDSMRVIDGGMPTVLVGSETRLLCAKLSKAKITFAQEEVTFAVIAAMNRLVRAYRAMMPQDRPSWMHGNMSDPRVSQPAKKAS